MVNLSNVSFCDRKSNAKKKLSLVCINDATIDTFLHYIEQYNTLPTYPSLWYTLSMNQLVEATMHLQMGVIKATVVLIHNWAYQMGNNNLLFRHMNSCITMFTVYCRIDSYQLVTYTDNYIFPGWIADTCRMWNKLMPWLYLCLRIKDFSFTTYIPEGDIKKWKKEECLKFCKTRKIDIDKNLPVGTLRNKIITIYTNNNNKFPKHCKSNLQSITIQQIQQLVWYCHIMFKTFFEIDINTRSNTHELTTKQFLSSISNIAAILNKDNNNKPILIRKYNFISLLQAMMDGKRNWTSGHYIHEGGKEGKGMIKHLRPLLPTNLRHNFGSNLIKNKYKKDSLDFVYENITKVHKPFDKQQKNIKLTNSKCKRYKNVAYVNEYIKLGVPINIVIVYNNKQDIGFDFGPLIKQEDHLYMLKINVIKSTNYKWEFTYHEIEMSNVPVHIHQNYEGGLLLPEIQKLNQPTKMMYAIVTIEMKFLNDKNKFI